MPLDTLPQLQRARTLPQDTQESSTLPLCRWNKLLPMPKPQSPSILPLEPQGGVAHAPVAQECYNLMLQPERDATMTSQNDTALLAGGTEKNYNSYTNNTNMCRVPDTVHGIQTPLSSFKTMGRPIFSSTVVRPDIGHDSNSSINSNSVNTFDRVYERLESFTGTICALCNSVMLQTSSSPPSDTSQDDNLPLGLSDTSSTTDLLGACTTDSTAQARVTPDVSVLAEKSGWHVLECGRGSKGSL